MQEQVQQRIAEVEKKAAEKYAEESAEIHMLNQMVHNNALSLDARRNALEKLQQLVPDYHAALTAEGKLINDNTDAIDGYLASLEKKIKMEAFEEELTEVMKKKIEAQRKLQEMADAEKERQENPLANIETQHNPYASQMQEQAEALTNTTKAIWQGQLDQAEESIRQITQMMNKMNVNPLEGKVKKKTDGDPAGGGGGDDDKSKGKNKFQAEDDWREREQALNRIAYAKGTADYEQYNARMLEIEVEYNRKKLAHKDLVGNEEVTIEASYQEALKKQRQNAIEGTVQQEEVAYKEVMAILQQKYMDGELSARQYQNAIELAELEHLRKVANLYQDGSKERLKAEKHYHDTSLKYQQKHLQEARQAQEKMRQTYFTKGFRVTDDESYQRDMQNLELVYKQMLKAAGDSKRDRLRVERAFYEAKYQLARKYNKREAKELKRSFRGAIDDSIAWLESDAGKAMTESFSTIVNQMGAIFSGLSDIIQAELDIQTARIEAKYDREISYAEGNKSQEVALEQQKQAEIGKAKQEANRKMFAMQVMQAVAQTAMSAIAAYSSAAAIPVVGFVMAPIAAAMAVAAGAIQIAAIKKQQEASEATGYMEGGFTKPGRKDEPAGIVHAGEWVASQDLLRNPQARAMIETLDYAQRTNTIGRLSASDVSQSITAPQRIAKASSNGELLAVAAASQALSRSVNEMNNRLHEPFVTVNTVTGDAGIKKAQDEYNQLMRNKTPKSRR